MAEEATPIVDGQKPADAAAANKQTPATATTVQPDPKTDPAKDGGAAAKAKVVLDDPEDDPKPDADGNVTMPMAAFLKRAARMTRAQLRKNFGTDDIAKIVEDHKELQTLRDDKAKREREQMSEKEKLEADLKAANDRADAAERRSEQAEDRVIRTHTERRVESLAGKHVDADSVDYAMAKFKSYVRKNPEEFKSTKLEKHEDRMDEWFKDFAEKHPKHAKAAAQVDVKADDKKKVGADNGIKKVAPEGKKQDGGPPAKAVKDMTRAEVREFAAARGINLP